MSDDAPFPTVSAALAHLLGDCPNEHTTGERTVVASIRYEEMRLSPYAPRLELQPREGQS